MMTSTFRLGALLLIALVIATVTSIPASSATSPPAPAKDCVPPTRRTTAEAVKGFVADPASLLQQSGGKLAADVRNLAVTSPDAIAAMPKLLAGATAAQAGAIGSGLGQAALVCKRTAPEVAQAIQRGVVGSERPEVVAAYEAVLQEPITAAVDPGSPAAEADNVVLGEAIEGGGPFPRTADNRAAGVLPLTSYYATPAVLAGGRRSASSTLPSTLFISVPDATSSGLITPPVAPTTGALQSVSPAH